MLFKYKSQTKHEMEQMHEFIEFIFFDVWCQAPNTEYDIQLFSGNDKLFSIMNTMYQLDLAEKLKDGVGKSFYELVNKIFNEFKNLTSAEIVAYSEFFKTNNSIEKLCAGVDNLSPSAYDSLDSKHDSLNHDLETFFTTLYSSGFFNLKFVTEQIGTTLDKYYKDFVKLNDDCVCPFCGLLQIDGEHDPTRDAFDHYLPKSKYPFNSVNLKNLAPSCSKCNSGNKRDQDPIIKKNGQRRKAFYPFSDSRPDIDIDIKVAHKNWSNLSIDDLAISITSPSATEEVETWKTLFRIEERYLSKCVRKDGGQAWLQRVFDEASNYGLTPEKMLEAEIASSINSPWTDANFLRRPFLEACQRRGLFDTNPPAAP